MGNKGHDAMEQPDPPQQPANRFDEAAATWDENPHRRQLSEAIAGAVGRSIPLQKDWRVLEYGCGTATLGFLLAPRVRQVVAADASPGMIEQVSRKLDPFPAMNLVPTLLDLSRHPAPADRFDLIVTAMTMHHVEDVETVLARLGSMLAEEGWLAIADLCPEDGSFHPDFRVPHNGFAPEILAHVVARCVPGMHCQWRIIHTVTKSDRPYEIFLLTGRRTRH